MNTSQLIRLLQLASPALPIGTYSYSQGLEWAVACGQVHDLSSARRWIGDALDLVVGPGEAAIAGRLMEAVRAGQWSDFVRWNAWFRASREAAELRAETEQMGGSLLKLLAELAVLTSEHLEAAESASPLALPAAFALAVDALAIEVKASLAAYVFSWLENQTLAAMKLIPLGQSNGQRLLYELGGRIPAMVDRALLLPDDEISSFAPGLALASSRHETQYSRLFRS